jgi:hypothetical protein
LDFLIKVSQLSCSLPISHKNEESGPQTSYCKEKWTRLATQRSYGPRLKYHIEKTNPSAHNKHDPAAICPHDSHSSFTPLHLDITQFSDYWCFIIHDYPFLTVFNIIQFQLLTPMLHKLHINKCTEPQTLLLHSEFTFSGPSSTQLPKEMRAPNLPAGKVEPVTKANKPTTVSKLSRKCERP